MSETAGERASAAMLDEHRAEPRRFKVRFRSREALEASLAIEAVGGSVAVALPERHVLSVEVPASQVATLSDTFDTVAREFDAEIVEDYRYSLEQVDFFSPLSFVPEVQAQQSLSDVITQIGADRAWQSSRGAGIVIAIVDTGTVPRRPSPAWRRWRRSRKVPGARNTRPSP